LVELHVVMHNLLLLMVSTCNISSPS